MAEPQLPLRPDRTPGATTDSDPALRELTSRYPVVRELASGGSGARLFVVQDTGAGATRMLVAKYFAHPKGGQNQGAREERAVGLALAAGKALALIVDSHSSELCYWYVMPLFSGETLHDHVVRVSAGGRIGGPAAHWEQALRWMAGLLSQVAVLHDLGLVHKDIKPGNLMVDGDAVKLIDIGLLTAADSQALLTVGGTIHYRDGHMDSLEALSLRVSESNPQSFDVYSAGAVMYFVFEGRHPPDGRLSLFGPATPVAVQHVARRAMARTADRYPSARAMLADVQRLLEATGRGKLMDLRLQELPSRNTAPPDSPAVWGVLKPNPEAPGSG